LTFRKGFKRKFELVCGLVFPAAPPPCPGTALMADVPILPMFPLGAPDDLASHNRIPINPFCAATSSLKFVRALDLQNGNCRAQLRQWILAGNQTMEECLMTAKTIDNNIPDETEILRLRPSWQSFFVFFLGILICVGGPLLNEDSQISLPVGIFFGAIFLIIIIRRRLNLYVLTDRRLSVESAPFSSDRREILLSDIADIAVNQGMALRLINSGHVLVSSKNQNQANIILFGLMKPLDFKKQLEKLIAETTAAQNNEAN